MSLHHFLILFLAISGFTPHSFGEVPPAKKPLPLHSAIEDKNFYLLSLFQTNAELSKVIALDKTLKELDSARRQRLKSALQTCQQNPACKLQPLMWTDEDIQIASGALSSIYQNNPGVKTVIDNKLQSSGAYLLGRQRGGKEVLVDAWVLCARGINGIIAVYGEGSRPRYPKIDSISFDINSPDFKKRIASLTLQISAEPTKLFFESSLNAALQLLALNHRDEAGRFEPMENKINRAALRSIPSTYWGSYPFSVIVVPGEGPEDPNVALATVGRQRTALAAAAYHAGKAPFILVSGGYVHPSQTRFSEAIEMRNALLRDYHVPEKAIFVDPHARHTTTNMRNAVREIYRYDMPMDKPALVISDPSQITYIQGRSLADRCRRELGYVPYTIEARPSDTSLIFLPNIESLQQNPLDPLDP